MTPIATHMYRGLPFKIYRNIKRDTGLRDALHGNYSISAAGDLTGRRKRKEGGSHPVWGLLKTRSCHLFGVSPGRVADAS